MVFGAESTIKALRELGKFDDEAKGIKKALYKKLRGLVTEELVMPTRQRIQAIPDSGPLRNWNASKAVQGGLIIAGSGKSGAARKARRRVRGGTAGQGIPAWHTNDAAALVGIDTRMKGRASSDAAVYVGKSIISVRSGSGAAEVMEFAGKKTDNALARNLQAKFGNPGRLLWHVFDANNVEAKTEPAIREAIREAEAETQAVLDRITGSQP